MRFGEKHISYPIKDDVQNYFNCLEQVIPPNLLEKSITYNEYYEILENQCLENPILIDLHNLDTNLRAFGIVEGGQKGGDITLKNKYNTIKNDITEYCNEITSISGGQTKKKADIQTKKIIDNDSYYKAVNGILIAYDIIENHVRGPLGGVKRTQRVTVPENINKEGDLYPTALQLCNRILGLSLEERSTEETSSTYAVFEAAKYKRSGKWANPDVFGLLLNSFPKFVEHEIETISIEVKLKIDKVAIAETVAHRNVSNYPYLMVNQYFEQIANTFLYDHSFGLLKLGLGLICRTGKNNFAVIFHPQKSEYQKEDLDEYIEHVKNNTDNPDVSRDLKAFEKNVRLLYSRIYHDLLQEEQVVFEELYKKICEKMLNAIQQKST